MLLILLLQKKTHTHTHIDQYVKFKIKKILNKYFLFLEFVTTIKHKNNCCIKEERPRKVILNFYIKKYVLI